jgi:hypothetical protein
VILMSLSQAPGQPVDLPLESPDGRPPRRVHVYEELGVPIYFEPSSRDFIARVGTPPTGRGSQNELRSPDFDRVIAKIRERALIVPVAGFQLDLDIVAEADEDLVRVVHCTVIEHHPRRLAPFVIRLVERGRWVLRTVERVYLPDPHHVEQVRRAVRALREEARRHQAEQARLRAGLTEAIDAIPLLDGGDVRYVQQEGAQLAADAQSVGAVVFDLRPDSLEEDDHA